LVKLVLTYPFFLALFDDHWIDGLYQPGIFSSAYLHAYLSLISSAKLKPDTPFSKQIN